MLYFKELCYKNHVSNVTVFETAYVLCVYVCMYVCVYVCVCVYIYIYITICFLTYSPNLNHIV